MIVVRLMGGLGNQMFQYAYGRAVSLRDKTELALDISWFRKQSKNIPRRYELDIFRSPQSLVDLNMFSKCWNKLTGDKYLNGYWQSEKYFKDIEDVVRSDFEFPLLDDERNEDASLLMQDTDSVSVHVRRTDYVSLPNVSACLGDICTREYYQKALRLMSDKVPDAEFFFFSDDIQWVKKNLGDGLRCHYVDWNNGLDSFRDMQLMSLCKHHIIANSSFSWWGAWLNKNPGKLVVAPGKWFNLANMDAKDIVPDDWIKVCLP